MRKYFWSGLLKHTMNFSNFCHKLIHGKFRRIRNITRITLKHYREAKWEIFLYRLNKETITFRAQWVREGFGWVILNPQKLEVEPLILELLYSVGEIDVIDSCKVAENRELIRKVATLLNDGFPLIIPDIKKAIKRGNNEENYERENKVMRDKICNSSGKNTQKDYFRFCNVKDKFNDFIHDKPLMNLT